MPAASCVRQLAPSPDLPTRSLAPAAPLRIRTSFQPRRARDFDDDPEPLTPETPFSPVSFPSSSPPRAPSSGPRSRPDRRPNPPRGRRAELLRRLRRPRRHARALVVTSAQAPYEVLDVNPAWTALCGYSREEVVGETLAVLHGNAGALAGLMAAVAAGRRGEAAVLNERKDGSKFLNWLRVSPLFDDGDHVWPSRYVGILEDHCAIQRCRPADFNAGAGGPVLL
ncbi:PAS domain-containing protein [Aureococcus anophagefferens]|nr:PAS domain-containing protein [Aureococcus anophagefferens]